MVPSKQLQMKGPRLPPSEQLLTVCLLTQDEETSLRKNPACDGVLCVVDKDTPCLSIRHKRKRGRRRVRRRRPISLELFFSDSGVPGVEEVAQVDGNYGQQVRRSEEILTDTRCPEAGYYCVRSMCSRSRGRSLRVTICV